MRSEKERNKQIYEERLRGVKYKELVEKYSLSDSSIRKIVAKEQQKEMYKENDVYRLLIALCEDEQLISKTFTVLNRIGATTEEELVKLDRKQLKKTRNCGAVMEELIMKMKEIIENRGLLI